MKPYLIVIPAHNEAEHIAEMVHSALRYAPVLVVDDGSTDDTALKASKAGAVLVHQSPNQGKGAALQAGFRKALEWGYDAVVTLDADGQHDPREIAAFVQMYERGPVDLIIGQRTFSQMPPVRRLANTLAQQVFSWAIGRPIPDNQSGFRMLGRRLIEALAMLEAEIDFPDEDLPGGLVEQALRPLGELRTELLLALQDPRGERVREGFRVALVGAPNAGKSSLFNALLRASALQDAATPLALMPMPASRFGGKAAIGW